MAKPLMISTSERSDGSRVHHMTFQRYNPATGAAYDLVHKDVIEKNLEDQLAGLKAQVTDLEAQLAVFKSLEVGSHEDPDIDLPDSVIGGQ